MPTLVLNLIADGYYRLTAGSAEYTKLLSDDGDTSYIASIASIKPWTFLADDSPGGSLSIQAVRAKIKFALTGSTNAYGPAPRHRYAAADYDGTANDDQIAGAGYRTWSYTLAPPVGGWTPAVVSQTEFGFVVPADTATGQFRVTYFFVEIDYQGAGLRSENAREVGAREMLLGRRPVQTIEIDAPLAFADVLPGQIISLSHEEGIADAAVGWGPNAWERRPIMVLGSSVEPNGMRTLIKALDVMQYVYLRSLWRTERTKEAFGADQQGAIKLDCGPQAEFLRDSPGFVQNAPDGVWRRAEKNVERISLDGVRIEPTRINAMPYSSFRDGYGSGGFYTITLGSGTVANDGTVLWFEPKDGIRYSLLITAGATHSSPTIVTGTATTAGYYAASRSLVVSVYHLEDYASAAHLAVRIKRTFDNYYWRDSDATWQAAGTDNDVPASTVKSIWRSKVIDVGANATGLQIEYRIPASGGRDGKKCWIFHGQHEWGNWASSPIETLDATPVERAVEGLRIYTSNPPHVWPLERGTAWLDFIPDWNSADLGLSAVLFDVNHGGTDFTRLRYDRTTGAWVFYQSRLGSVSSASLVAAAIRGTKYRVVVRWCSALGEWGLAPYTMSIWAGPTAGNGWVRGTDSVPAGLSVPLATRELWLGGKDMTAKAQAGGQISNLTITPLCLPDWMIEDL